MQLNKILRTMAREKLFLLLLVFFSTKVFAQPTFSITDPDLKYKQVKEFVVKEQYALAYPLVKELKAVYPIDRKSDFPFLADDILYFDILCRIELDIEAGSEEAELFIRSATNEPRVQMLSFHLAHYYFRHDEFENTITYFDKAGNDNLSNDQIADAKYEKGYAYFNLKDFEKANPLFDEIRQMPDHKYYYAANYYSGFIAYYNKDYNKALECFKKVESREEYKSVVPFYIAEIYYFQDKKEEALKYAEGVLQQSDPIYYQDQLKLLSGQMYFEKQDYEKALPLLDAYVQKTPKVSKEVLYQLSYANYKEGNSEKAIEGFRQLSNEKDSMGQNSMYLLGDIYLKAGQKENARNAFQYSAYNSSNTSQQKISRFQYAKLSYELGYQDIALKEIKSYLNDYPGSDYEAEGREILFGLLANSNDYKEAYTLYQSVAQPTPAMQKILPRILFGRAVELMSDQQPNKAIGLLKQVENDPNAGAVLPYAHFWLGELSYRNGEYDECIRHMAFFRDAKAASQGEANLSAANYATGYAYFQKENHKEAAGFFDQVAPSVSKSSSLLIQDAYMRSADCYYMVKNFTKAESMYDKVIMAALPQADNATYQKAMIAGVRSSSEKIKILAGLQRQFPQSSMQQEINIEIANTYMADEQFKEAIPYLNKIIESGDASIKPKAYLKLGLAHYNNDNDNDALLAFNQLLDKYPNSDETHEAMDVIKDIYLKQGRPDEYVDLMKKNGINVSVTEADSLSYAVGVAKYDNEDCIAAVKGFDNYLKRYPEGSFSLDALYLRSDCYRKSKDWQKALDGYKLVNEKGPSKYFDKATLEAARICYFELKDYVQARQYFESLHSLSSNPENTQEALRGLVRSLYQLKDYTKANDAATELIAGKNISTDDRSIGYLVLGKSQQLGGDCAAAINSFKSVTAINKAVWGAEARYEMASCYFSSGNLNESEKSALSVIKETSAFDLWVTKAYLLLGDIFMQEEDYFNAKATYESVSRNAALMDLRNEARQKLDKAVAAEKVKTKIKN